MTIQIIANPTAGRGRGAHLAPLAEQCFRRAGVPFELHYTRAQWHAAELAAALYHEGHRTVIVLGGDGTTNEVVNGLLEAARAGQDNGTVATIGVIPIGSGNDFCYPLGLPTTLEEACQRALRGRTQTIDVGLVQADNQAPRFFVNGVGIGFDAVVNIESRKFHRLRGATIYLAALLRTIAIYYSAPKVRVVYDGQTFSAESLMLSIMNGRRLGGIFHVAPQAILHDGLFDLLLSRRLSRLGILRMIPEFLRGTHIRHTDLMQLAHARHIDIEIDGTLPAHVDGEVYGVGAHHYELEILPACLNVLC